MNPWLMLSTQVARTQPDVVTPVMTSVSTPALVSEADEARAEERARILFGHDIFVVVGPEPVGKGLRRLALDEAAQRRRLAEEDAAVGAALAIADLGQDHWYARSTGDFAQAAARNRAPLRQPSPPNSGAFGS